MWQQLITSIVTTGIGAAAAAIFVHLFATRRDIALKRREIILPNLIAAIEALEAANTQRSDGNLKRLEEVVSRIQKFGDAQLFNLAKKMVTGITQNGHSENNDLYFELRDRIRAELGLTKLPREFVGLMIDIPHNEHDKVSAKAEPSTRNKT